MSGYSSRVNAERVVRTTVEANTLGLPKDTTGYNMAAIYRAVIVNRGPGYGYSIEFVAERFWDAVRANLRPQQSAPVVESVEAPKVAPAGTDSLLRRYVFERKTPSGWLATGSYDSFEEEGLSDLEWFGAWRVFDTLKSKVIHWSGAI